MQSAPPLGRIGLPEEVSPAVVFLLSEAAAYVTGADLLVSGGIHTGRGEFFFSSVFFFRCGFYLEEEEEEEEEAHD